MNQEKGIFGQFSVINAEYKFDNLKMAWDGIGMTDVKYGVFLQAVLRRSVSSGLLDALPAHSQRSVIKLNAF